AAELDAVKRQIVPLLVKEMKGRVDRVIEAQFPEMVIFIRQKLFDQPSEADVETASGLPFLATATGLGQCETAPHNILTAPIFISVSEHRPVVTVEVGDRRLQ